MNEEHELPPWEEVVEAKQAVIGLLEKKFKHYTGADKLVALAIIKPTIVEIVYANAAMNRLKERTWDELF